MCLGIFQSILLGIENLTFFIFKGVHAMRNLLSAMFFLVLVSTVFTRPADATPVFDNGVEPQLIGFTDIWVTNAGQDQYYDVEFIDGRLSDIFDADNLTFTTLDSALAAASALMEAYGTLTDEYKVPNRTRGIEDLYRRQIVTPYLMVKNVHSEGTYGSYYGYYHNHTTHQEYTQNMWVYESQNLIDYPALTWAVWTPSSSTPVPEPGTMVLMGTGLLSAAAVRSRRKRMK